MISSLEKLKLLTPTLVVPGLFIGEESFKRVNSQEWIHAVDDCIRELELKR